MMSSKGGGGEQLHGPGDSRISMGVSSAKPPPIFPSEVPRLSIVKFPPAPEEEPDAQAFDAETLARKSYETWERNLRLSKAGVKPYATTSLPLLDNALGDWMWPGLYVLHGVAGAGKSALASQIAVKAGVPVLYVTCEMTPTQMFSRMTALSTRTSLYVLNNRQTPPEVVKKAYDKSSKSLAHVTICDGTTPPALTAQWIMSMCLMIMGSAEATPLVIIDSLHAWTETVAGGQGDSEYNNLNGAISALRKVIAYRNCPVVAISERNRAAMNTGGLAASRGSGRIEYTADVVLDFGKDEKEGSHRPNEAIDVTLRIVKNRFGATGGAIPLRFDPTIMEFAERPF